MSIKDRLALKTGDLVAGPGGQIKSDPGGVELQVVEARAPRTGPGQMLAYRSHMQENNQKVQELQDQLKSYDGSLPVRKLDPKLVVPSKWANRHESSFDSAEFAELKAEIESARGNVQPIRVRPSLSESSEFEIVYGHRRHQACLQLGLPVSALVELVDDKSLFAAMDRENRSRADLSPFEQGDMYRRALDEGLFPSLRQLSSELGVDLGNASKAIAIARLPREVLAAFESPTQIQYRWGQELIAALQKDPEGVVERAKSIRFSAKQLPATEALERLLGRVKPKKPIVMDLKRKGKVIGKLTRKLDGSVAVSLNRDVINDGAITEFRALIENFIAGK